MPDDEDDNYKVGWGKPPRRSQFKRGQSGNPKGSPRGSKSLSALFAKALSEPVVVNENGRRKKISKTEAMLKQLANKAALGDPQVAKFVFEQDSKSKGRLGDRPPPPQSAPIPDELSFWAQVVVVMWECGALSNPPLGLKEALETANWDLIKKIAYQSPEDQAAPDSGFPKTE
jgi:hypothetical protein